MQQDALRLAPVFGDLEKVQANQEFRPSTKEEKRAATLHAEAIRLFNEKK